MSSEAFIAGNPTAPWRRSLGVGIVVLAACAVGGWLQPEPFFRAYLAAYVFYLGIALGSMVLLMVYHLTGGSWGLLIRRILEAAMRTLPLAVLFFLPIACGLRYLYVWARPAAAAASPKLQYQQFYLNPAGYWIRAAVYFILWMGIAWLLACWSRQEDQRDNPGLASKYLNLSGLGAVVYGISLHFAAVDWVMSLEPVFHSTIWGPLFATGQLLSALAFALLVLPWLVERSPLAEVTSQGARKDLASLLLTLLIVWAYMAWFQFMLVWIANMPVDIVWYLPRATTAWKGVMWAIFLLHFALPFFLLLMRSIKRSSKAVGRIAAVILLMQLVFVYYQVIPGSPAAGLRGQWMNVLLPVGIGGIWLAGFFRQLGRYPLLPLYDHNRHAALRLRALDEEETARHSPFVEDARGPCL